MYHTTHPHHEYSIFAEQHARRQEIARTERLARALTSGRGSSATRGRVVTSLVAALIVMVVGSIVIVPRAAGGDVSSESPPCTAADGSYDPGCRMLPGHADGWFRASPIAADDATSGALVPVNRVR